MNAGRETPRTVCVNRRARHDYELLDRVEAGLVLAGTEVKALREGKGNLVDAYVLVRDGHASLINFEISRYSNDATAGPEARRTRDLLLHAREIRKLATQTREKGLTLVPLSVYFKGPWAKVEVAVARGRRRYDKRAAIAKRDAERQIERVRRRR